MFNTDTPIKAAEVFQDYLIDNMGAFPEVAKEKLAPFMRERGIAELVIGGMEMLYSALRQVENMPNVNDGWNAVGHLAYHIIGPNLWGKGERAYQIMTLANQRINGVPDGVEGISPPDLDPAYLVIPPVAPEMPPAPVAPVLDNPPPVIDGPAEGWGEPTPEPAPAPAPTPEPEPSEPG